jgi:hypothetical protein
LLMESSLVDSWLENLSHLLHIFVRAETVYTLVVVFFKLKRRWWGMKCKLDVKIEDKIHFWSKWRLDKALLIEDQCNFALILLIGLTCE